MKIPLRILAPACSITLLVAGCAAEDGGEVVGPEIEGDGYADEGVMTPLAQFVLSNGNVIVFSASEETGDIACEESGLNGTPPTFDADTTLSVLDKYLALTSDETPVPRLLAELANDREDHAETLAARPQVEALSAPVELTVPHEEGLQPLTHVFTYNCYGGNTAANFESTFCHFGGSAVQYCDSNAWYYLKRIAPLKAENTYNATTYCGSDFAHVTHLRYSAENKCCNFPGTTTASIGNNAWRWMHVSGPRRYRRIDHYRGPYAPWDNYENYSGYVRAQSLFFDDQ